MSSLQRIKVYGIDGNYELHTEGNCWLIEELEDSFTVLCGGVVVEIMPYDKTVYRYEVVNGYFRIGPIT